MVEHKKSELEILVEKLDKELMARGAGLVREKLIEFSDREGTPQRDCIITDIQDYYGYMAPPSPDKVFSHIATPDLAKMLMLKIQELNTERGIWGEESRMDYYEIKDTQIKKNADSVAAICMKENLLNIKQGVYNLKVKNYGKVFNLCQSEPFYHQDVAAGRLCSGFLVKDDIIATAGHCVNENNLADLRFVFGYRITDSSASVKEILHRDIYKGEKIIHKVYKREGDQSDWALVKLDRKVEGLEVVTLSKKEITRHKPVYIIGHPVGLPLKYSPGASVSDIGAAHFSADLNVYCGNSGSPVFDCETHEVIGMVVRGDTRDFRLVEKCWKSVIYSRARVGSNSPEPQCTKASQFISDCS